MPAKICNLRVDTLAIMLSLANVGANAQVRYLAVCLCVDKGFRARAIEAYYDYCNISMCQVCEAVWINSCRQSITLKNFKPHRPTSEIWNLCSD